MTTDRAASLECYATNPLANGRSTRERGGTTQTVQPLSYEYLRRYCNYQPRESRGTLHLECAFKDLTRQEEKGSELDELEESVKEASDLLIARETYYQTQLRKIEKTLEDEICVHGRLRSIFLKLAIKDPTLLDGFRDKKIDQYAPRHFSSVKFAHKPGIERFEERLLQVTDPLLVNESETIEFIAYKVNSLLQSTFSTKAQFIATFRSAFKVFLITDYLLGSFHLHLENFSNEGSELLLAEDFRRLKEERVPLAMERLRSMEVGELVDDSLKKVTLELMAYGISGKDIQGFYDKVFISEPERPLQKCIEESLPSIEHSFNATLYSQLKKDLSQLLGRFLIGHTQLLSEEEDVFFADLLRSLLEKHNEFFIQVSSMDADLDASFNSYTKNLMESFSSFEGKVQKMMSQKKLFWQRSVFGRDLKRALEEEVESAKTLLLRAFPDVFSAHKKSMLYRVSLLLKRAPFV